MFFAFSAVPLRYFGNSMASAFLARLARNSLSARWALWKTVPQRDSYWPELQIDVMQLAREGSPATRLAPTSGEVATEFQSDSARTDSAVRVRYAQPGSPSLRGLRNARFWWQAHDMPRQAVGADKRFGASRAGLSRSGTRVVHSMPFRVNSRTPAGPRRFTEYPACRSFALAKT
jgi:hypothetical protein